MNLISQSSFFLDNILAASSIVDIPEALSFAAGVFTPS